MSEKLKKFFQKNKTENKFKSDGGPVLCLDDESVAENLPTAGVSARICRVEPTNETKLAVSALVARFENKKTAITFPKDNSLAAIKLRVLKELEVEKKNMNQRKNTFTYSKKPSSSDEISGSLATQGIFFQCPMIGFQILSQKEWYIKIEKYIMEEMKEDPILQSIMLIYNCNNDKSKDKVEDCIKLLVTYVENCIRNKDEEKFQKIRLANETFIEKVVPIRGAVEFLESIGFVKKTIVYENQEEYFLVFHKECLDNLALVQSAVDDLQSTKQMPLVLDRNIQVLLPSQATENVLLPKDFFVVSPAELNKEPTKWSEKLKNKIILKTKNTRIKEHNKFKLNYKYCLIRIQLPDCLILQGTFGVNERLSDVLEFVKESLFDEERPFKLKLSSGHTFGIQDDYNKTLYELKLVPTSILFFIDESPDNNQEHLYLKDELISLIQVTF